MESLNKIKVENINYFFALLHRENDNKALLTAM